MWTLAAALLSEDEREKTPKTPRPRSKKASTAIFSSELKVQWRRGGGGRAEPSRLLPKEECCSFRQIYFVNFFFVKYVSSKYVSSNKSLSNLCFVRFLFSMFFRSGACNQHLSPHGMAPQHYCRWYDFLAETHVIC